MYRLAQKHREIHKAIIVGVALVYVVITWALPLLHSDDCPATHAGEGTGSSVPSDGACPACKCLAGSNATEAHCDAGPALIRSEIVSELPEDSQVVVPFPCRGSIILRGPPPTSLS
jgi:hypothetical protein